MASRGGEGAENGLVHGIKKKLTHAHTHMVAVAA
jgi:hypothetical protein